MEAREEILAEINLTFDRLIQNSDALKQISASPKYKVEIEALEKTQESLFAHLFHLENYLKEKGTHPPELDQAIKKIHFNSRPRPRHSKKALKNYP